MSETRGRKQLIQFTLADGRTTWRWMVPVLDDQGNWTRWESPEQGERTLMAYYEIGPVSSHRGERWELWENDGSIDGRAIAVDLSAFDAPRLCALLNLARPKAGGLRSVAQQGETATPMVTLSDEELRNLVDNAGKELVSRTKARAALRARGMRPCAPDTSDDTIDALAEGGPDAGP